MPPQQVICLSLYVEPLHRISNLVFGQTKAQRFVLQQSIDTECNLLCIPRSHQDTGRVVQPILVQIPIAKFMVGNL